jgi:type 1 glutamine amidotransferase
MRLTIYPSIFQQLALTILAIGVSSGLFASGAAAAETAETPPKAARLLFVTESQGFRHGAVTRQGDKLAVAEQVMTELGISTGLFRAECTQDSARDFTKEKLQDVDIVMFYTTGDLPIPEDVREYFFDTWLKQPGHGFLGVHSAADTYHNYKPYWDMIGGTFNGHPWGAGSTVTVTVHDEKHPMSKVWGEEFELQDEIYRFKNWQPEKVHVLMSLNMAKTDLKEPYHVPVAWVKDYGQGKVAHMSLGHREDVWTNPTYQASLAGAIRWMLGLEEGDATPNPELSKAEEQKAKEVVEAAKAK